MMQCADESIQSWLVHFIPVQALTHAGMNTCPLSSVSLITPSSDSLFMITTDVLTTSLDILLSHSIQSKRVSHMSLILLFLRHFYGHINVAVGL